MFDPLFKVHTIVGIALNGFLKMTSTVCILFAAISTPPVVPDCVLLFYDTVTVPSSVININDDHAGNGIVTVSPLFVGFSKFAPPILISLMPEPDPIAYMFVNLFMSVMSNPVKWLFDVSVMFFSAVSDPPQ